jgi:hypothetical protein
MAVTKTPGGSVDPSELGILPDADAENPVPAGLYRLHEQDEVEVILGAQPVYTRGEIPRGPLRQHNLTTKEVMWN